MPFHLSVLVQVITQCILIHTMYVGMYMFECMRCMCVCRHERACVCMYVEGRGQPMIPLLIVRPLVLLDSLSLARSSPIRPGWLARSPESWPASVSLVLEFKSFPPNLAFFTWVLGTGIRSSCCVVRPLLTDPSPSSSAPFLIIQFADLIEIIFFALSSTQYMGSNIVLNFPSWNKFKDYLISEINKIF